jgi:hypothetical protein
MGEAHMSEQTQENQARDLSQVNLPVPPSSTREPLPVPPAQGREAVDSEPVRPISGFSAPDSDAHTKFSEFIHQYIREYIRAADQKATFFFAGSTALLAFLYRNNLSARWMKPIMQWNLLDVVSFVAMMALAVGALTAVFVVIPRTPGSRRGFIFWEAIAEYATAREYSDEVSSLSAATMSQVTAEHCFDLARVCRRKYKVLRCALWICAVGLAATSLVFLFV